MDSLFKTLSENNSTCFRKLLNLESVTICIKNIAPCYRFLLLFHIKKRHFIYCFKLMCHLEFENVKYFCYKHFLPWYYPIFSFVLQCAQNAPRIKFEIVRIAEYAFWLFKLKKKSDCKFIKFMALKCLK